MDGYLFTDRLKQGTEFRQMEKDLDESVLIQRDTRREFNRFMTDAQDDAGIITVAKIVKKTARRLRKKERISELDDEIKELDTHLCPVEESDKDYASRLDAVAKTKTKNKDVDHVSLALRREILSNERAVLKEDRAQDEQLKSCVAALLKIDPMVDYTCEDYFMEHVAQFNSLIKNGETFIRLSAASQKGDDQALLNAFAGFSDEELTLCSKLSSMAGPARAAMEKICRLKGVDPETGAFVEKGLSRSEKQKLRSELDEDRAKLQTEAMDAAKYKNENIFEKIETDAESAARRKKLADDLRLRRFKREQAMKEAIEKKRLQSLVDTYSAAYPAEVRERKAEKINITEQKIVYRIADEKMATHLLLSLDILRNLGEELDYLKDRFYIEDKCLFDHYGKDYNVAPSSTTLNIHKERENEIEQRETEFQTAYAALEKMISDESLPLKEGETEQDRLDREDAGMRAALGNLTDAQKHLSPVRQRMLARNMVVRQKRTVTLRKIEQLKEQRSPLEKAEELKELQQGTFLDANGALQIPSMVDATTVYKQFMFIYRQKHGDNAPVPSEEEMEEIVHDYLKAIMKRNTSMQIRVPDCEVLDQIIDSGRFKTQIETGSSKGALDVERRKNFTAEKFGIDPKAFSDASYEVYGYLSDGNLVNESRLKEGNEEPVEENVIGKVASYGQIIVKLKTMQMLPRTTVSFGDSLDDAENFSPALLDNPDALAVRAKGRPWTYVKALEWYEKKREGDIHEVAMMEGLNHYLSKMRDMTYVELQFHGGVSALDIESVTLVPKLRPRSMGDKEVFKEDKDIPDELVRKLEYRGIKVFVIQNGEKIEKHSA